MMEKSKQKPSYREETSKIESVSMEPGCRSSLLSGSLNPAVGLEATRTVEDTGLTARYADQSESFLVRVRNSNKGGTTVFSSLSGRRGLFFVGDEVSMQMCRNILSTD
ncbi:hypothetical protein D3C78_926540 [compost metagenome]